MSSMRAAANSGLWRSVTERGSHPTGSVTGCAARHEARHSPRLRLAPPCSQPRSRSGVAELGVVRPREPLTNMLLPTIYPVASPESYKLHLACWNGSNQPLDVFVRSRTEWDGWNSWRNDRDDFSREFIFALISFYPEAVRWLFV